MVVGIEMKLVAELHEAAGIALPQSLSDKATLIARSWAESRGVRRDDVVLLAQAAGWARRRRSQERRPGCSAGRGAIS